MSIMIYNYYWKKKRPNFNWKIFFNFFTEWNYFYPRMLNNAPEREHFCPTCSKSYRRSTALWRHRKYECGKNPRFQCPYCTFKSKQRGNSFLHIKLKHPGENVYALDLEPGN